MVTRQVDLGTLPLYVRAGAIVPFDPVRQYASQPVSEPTTLRVYAGADGEYTLFADDGITQEYLELRGTWIRMTWNDRTRQLSLEPGAPKGATNLASKRAFRVLLLPSGMTKDISYEAKRVEARF
jgi:alpha-glucosidase/alpha-D-xyloside xylohydrolase